MTRSARHRRRSAGMRCRAGRPAAPVPPSVLHPARTCLRASPRGNVRRDSPGDPEPTDVTANAVKQSGAALRTSAAALDRRFGQALPYAWIDGVSGVQPGDKPHQLDTFIAGPRSRRCNPGGGDRTSAATPLRRTTTAAPCGPTNAPDYGFASAISGCPNPLRRARAKAWLLLSPWPRARPSGLLPVPVSTVTSVLVCTLSG